MSIQKQILVQVVVRRTQKHQQIEILQFGRIVKDDSDDSLNHQRIKDDSHHLCHYKTKHILIF